MRFFIFVSFILFLLSGVSSQTADSLRSLLVQQATENFTNKKPAPRKFLSLKEKSIAAKINPLTYVAGSLMFVYQNVFSEQIQANCNYEVSCSNFAKLSIEQRGLIEGLFAGLDQFMNCFPGASFDYPKCRINELGKVINQPEAE